MEGLADHPSIMHTLLEYISPITYVCLRRALPTLMRRPKVYPDGRVFLWARLKMALLTRLGPELGGAVIGGLINTPWPLMQHYQLAQDSHLRLKAGPDADRQLDYRRAYITGGFLLAVMQADAIDNDQDVDLLVTEDPHPLTEQLEQLHMHDTQEERYHESHDYELDWKVVTKRYRVVGVDRPPVIIQFICNENCKSRRNQVDAFDFTFCSNAANETMFYVKDITGVVRREACVVLPEYVNHYQRTIRQAHDSASLRLQTRTRKYRQRGYTVTIEQPWSEAQLLDALDHLEYKFVQPWECVRLMGRHGPDKIEDEDEFFGEARRLKALEHKRRVAAEFARAFSNKKIKL